MYLSLYSVETMNISLPLNATRHNWSALQPNLTLWLSCMLLLCCIGTIITFTLLLMFLIKESLRNAVGYLTASYLFSNLLMLSINMPVYCISVFFSLSHSTPIAHCEHTYYFFMVNTHSLYYSWFFIAIHQLVAIFFPFAFHQLTSYKLVGLKIVLTWLIPLIINLPVRLGYGGRYIPGGPFGACMVELSKNPYPNILVFLGVYIPSVFVQAVYVAVLVKFAALRVSRRRVWSVSVTSDRLGLSLACTPRRQFALQRSSVALHPAVTRMVVSFLYISCFVIFMLTRLYDRQDFLAMPVLELWIMAFFIAPYVLSVIILAASLRLTRIKESRSRGRLSPGHKN
ncbi:uncharacterized protein LOC129599317 [Paramacrobiotus metropolitanus]|uniref:uncharacterized protein LOC129599317 n=1 Tax=Paramacrobiotus metropolitanus TaxID=2943436 RepID=UPI0024461B05|nr:uncharacterized protein LOC129599317 [Paramacrobiotus metropolitanus]